jgi:Putative peptidoglycan binding domain
MANPTIKKGSRGEAVKLLQRMLKSYGLAFDPGSVDGDFGPITETAVKMFQSVHSLTVDGIVGPKTWSALDGGLRASTGASEVHLLDDGGPFFVFRIGTHLLLIGLAGWLVALGVSAPRFALAAALLVVIGALSVMFGALSGRRNVTISVR